MSRKLVVAAAGGLLGLSALFSVATLTAHAGPPTPVPSAGSSAAKEIPAVKAAFDEAILTQLGLQSCNAVGNPRITPAERPGAMAGKTVELPAQAIVAQCKHDHEAQADRVFANSASARKRAQVAIDNVNAASQDPNQRIFGSGVSSIAYTSVEVMADGTALVSAEVHAWSHFAMKDGTGEFKEAAPEGIVRTTATLSKIGDAWSVTELDWNYTP